jgi:hypothetical protein
MIQCFILHQKLFPTSDLTINQIVNYLYYQRPIFSKTERFLCCEDEVTYSIYLTNKLILTKIKMNGYAQFDVLVYFRIMFLSLKHSFSSLVISFPLMSNKESDVVNLSSNVQKTKF